MYDWVLSWADTRFGATALFLVAFAESSFFPIPPDVLLIPLCLGARSRWFRLAAVCTVGSVMGGAMGYGIGKELWDWVDHYFFNYVPGFSYEVFQKVQKIYREYDFWFVFVAGFTPFPYKIITISAGVFGLNFFTFMIATIVGRAARFFLVAYLIYRIGEPVRHFIDRHFNLLTIVFTILLVGGFAVVKFVL